MRIPANLDNEYITEITTDTFSIFHKKRGNRLFLKLRENNWTSFFKLLASFDTEVEEIFKSAYEGEYALLTPTHRTSFFAESDGELTLIRGWRLKFSYLSAEYGISQLGDSPLKMQEAARIIKSETAYWNRFAEWNSRSLIGLTQEEVHRFESAMPPAPILVIATSEGYKGLVI